MNKKLKIFLIILASFSGTLISASDSPLCEETKYLSTKVLILSPNGFYYDPLKTRPIDFIKVLPEINPDNMVMITSRESIASYDQHIELVEEYKPRAHKIFSCFFCANIPCFPCIKFIFHHHRPCLRVIAVNQYEPVSPGLSYNSQITEVDAQILKVREDGFAFDKIIFFHEYDVLRGLMHHPSLGLEIEFYNSALCYRNKGTMYSHIQKHNQKMIEESKKISIPAYISIQTLLEFENLKELIDSETFDIPFPLVIKPAFGVSSKDTHILRSKDEWNSFVANEYPKHYEIAFEDEIAPKDIMIVQEFVSDDPHTHAAPMYHIDSLIKPNSQGEILWAHPSAYVSNPYDLRRGKPVGTYTLSPESRTTNEFKAFNQKVLEILPYIPSIAACHLEVFKKSDGTIFFCETAARPGGHLISDTMKAAFGFHICEQMFRLQAGLEPNHVLTQQPLRLAGSIISPQADDSPLLLTIYGESDKDTQKLEQLIQGIIQSKIREKAVDADSETASISGIGEIEHKDQESSSLDNNI